MKIDSLAWNEEWIDRINWSNQKKEKKVRKVEEMSRMIKEWELKVQLWKKKDMIGVNVKYDNEEMMKRQKLVRKKEEGKEKRKKSQFDVVWINQ